MSKHGNDPQPQFLKRLGRLWIIRLKQLHFKRGSRSLQGAENTHPATPNPFPGTKDLVFTLLRDTKWLTAVSALLSAILIFPNQAEELYRSILVDRKPASLALLYFSVLAVGFFIWFGARQVAVVSVATNKQTRIGAALVLLWPSLLGAAPLVSTALAQFDSIPTGFRQAEESIREIMDTPGRVWDKLDVELASSAGQALLWSGYGTL